MRMLEALDAKAHGSYIFAYTMSSALRMGLLVGLLADMKFPIACPWALGTHAASPHFLYLHMKVLGRVFQLE